MTDQELLYTIIANSFVKADVLRRVRIVREYLEQRFYTPGEKKDLHGYLETAGVDEADRTALHAWGEDFFRSFTKENAYELIEQVVAHIKTLPLLNLYVPVEVDNEQMKKLGRWVRDNVDKKVLIELHVDTATLGGCAFAWNGVYFDYTLRHYMRKKIDPIRKVISEYAQNYAQK